MPFLNDVLSCVMKERKRKERQMGERGREGEREKKVILSHVLITSRAEQKKILDY